MLACATAYADPSSSLRDGNTAATAGDWASVSKLVEPLLQQQLGQADLAEAHRLAGLAAFYLHEPTAEMHFMAYLRIDPEGHLDPALYPPEVLNYFNEIKSKHDVELRARRRPHKYMALNLLPPVGQIQNGEPTKAIVIGSLLGAFAITNVTSYLVLRSWCTQVSGANTTTVTCDDHKDHTHAASTLRSLNIATGVALIATYIYGVYDGVATYRRHERESAQPFIVPISNGAVVGAVWGF